MTVGSGSIMNRRATPRLFKVFAGLWNNAPTCGTANMMTARLTAGEPPVTGTYKSKRRIASTRTMRCGSPVAFRNTMSIPANRTTWNPLMAST